MFPKWEYLNNIDVWTVGLTIALVASIETLLGIEAIDKLDPLKRRTPANQELKAQGVGNFISGLLGGLPLTSVIVRGSANVEAGAKSKFSAILHGFLILLSVLFIPGLLNKIPLSALAAILIMTGYKLFKPSIFKEVYQKGWDQFVPFMITLLAILLTDLLVGIIIGTLIALFSLIKSNFKSAVMVVHDDNKYLVRFRKDISFLNKPIVKKNSNLLRETVASVRGDVEAGLLLSDALERHPKVFSPLYVAMVRAGETGGVLDACCIAPPTSSRRTRRCAARSARR